MATIPLALDEIELHKIDYLVKIGRYKNRSQAIRTILKEKLDHEIILPEEVDPEEESAYQSVMAEIRAQTGLGFRILSKKTAVDLVREQRDRD